MQARIDHVVLWVEDPLAAVVFYRDVVGLPGERVEAFEAGTAPFPSVRIADDAIVDLMPRGAAAFVDALSGASGAAGHPVNHLCLALGRADFEALRERLARHGVDVSSTMTNSFGAQGTAPIAFYFRDPDGNVLEARHYGA